MATEAQVKANQQNAQKSTGPKTDQGKAAVSQNALKHGLFATQDVLSVENQAEFDLLRDEMLAELAPVGAVESMLAHRVVSLAWRLRRAERMQDELTEDMIESHVIGIRVSLGRQRPKEPRYAPEYLALGQVAKKDWCGSRLTERPFEYERRIENSMARAMAQLRVLQLMRGLVEADVAEKQCGAQPDKATDSEKQSQFERWPQTYGISPKELSAFAKKTYGRRCPDMVEALLKRWNSSPCPTGTVRGPQAHGAAGNKGLPLSLLNL